MISDNLLKILVCPKTHLSLSLATFDQLQRVKAAVSNQELSYLSGDKIDENFDNLLLSEDKMIAYCIRDDIPVLLVEKGIDLSKFNT